MSRAWPAARRRSGRCVCRHRRGAGEARAGAPVVGAPHPGGRPRPGSAAFPGPGVSLRWLFSDACMSGRNRPPLASPRRSSLLCLVARCCRCLLTVEPQFPFRTTDAWRGTGTRDPRSPFPRTSCALLKAAGAWLPPVSPVVWLQLTFALPGTCSDLHKMHPFEVPASSVSQGLSPALFRPLFPVLCQGNMSI